VPIFPLARGGSEEKTTGPRGFVLLLYGSWRWRLSLDGVADRLKLADEFACSPVRVLTADEVVHAKIMVGLISLERVEDRHQDAVLDGDQGFGVAQARTQPGEGPTFIFHAAPLQEAPPTSNSSLRS
jgi:hypothetical protein